MKKFGCECNIHDDSYHIDNLDTSKFIEVGEQKRYTYTIDEIESIKYKIADEVSLSVNKIQNAFQRQLNLLDDRLRMVEGYKPDRKVCGLCDGTGSRYLGTICDPPIGKCPICNGMGFT